MNKQQQVMVVSAFLCLFAGMLFVLSSEQLRPITFLLASISTLLWLATWFPEALAVAYLMGGRVAEPRLKFFELPVSLSQLILAALLIALVFRRKELATSLRYPSVRGYLAIAAWASISMVWTLAPNYGTYKVGQLLYVTLPSLLAIVAFTKWRGHLYYSILALWGIGCGLASLGVGLFLVNLGENEARLSVLGGGPNVYSKVVGISVLISLLTAVHLLPEKSRQFRGGKAVLVGSILSMLLCSTAVLMAQSRGPVLSLIGALVIYLFFSSRSGRKQLLVAGCLVVLGGWFAVTSFQATELGNRFDPDVEANYGTIESRLISIDRTLDIIVESPRLGVGLGGWSVAYWGIDQKAYAHNFFVEVAAEFGLPVLAVFVLFLTSQMLTSLSVFLKSAPSRDRDVLLGLVVIFLYLLGTAQTSGDLGDNRQMWVLLATVDLARRRLPLRHQVTTTGFLADKIPPHTLAGIALKGPGRPNS